MSPGTRRRCGPEQVCRPCDPDQLRSVRQLRRSGCRALLVAAGLGEVRGGGSVADGELVEPAASRVAGGPVKAGDVGLDVEDGRPVEKINSGEHHGLAGDIQELDEAEPDRVDPPRPAGGENAHRPPLAAQQERNLPQWRLAGRVTRLVQPAEQPGVVETR